MPSRPGRCTLHSVSLTTQLPRVNWAAGVPRTYREQHCWSPMRVTKWQQPATRSRSVVTADFPAHSGRLSPHRSGCVWRCWWTARSRRPPCWVRSARTWLAVTSPTEYGRCLIMIANPPLRPVVAFHAGQPRLAEHGGKVDDIRRPAVRWNRPFGERCSGNLHIVRRTAVTEGTQPPAEWLPLVVGTVAMPPSRPNKSRCRIGHRAPTWPGTTAPVSWWICWSAVRYPTNDSVVAQVLC